MIFDSGAVLCVSLAIFLDAACDFVGLHRSATIGTGRTNRVVVKAGDDRFRRRCQVVFWGKHGEAPFEWPCDNMRNYCNNLQQTSNRERS